MAYATFSVVFGEQPSAAKWNILGTNDASFNDGTGIANLEIGSGHTSLKNDYKFSVYRNTAWTSGTPAVVQFDTKLFDTGSNVDIVTNKGRFTAPIAGYYFFIANAIVNSAPGTGVIGYLYKNGVQNLEGQASLSGNNTFHQSGLVSGLIQLSISDYVEYAFNGSGLAGGTGASQAYFQGFLVSTT